MRHFISRGIALLLALVLLLSYMPGHTAAQTQQFEPIKYINPLYAHLPEPELPVIEYTAPSYYGIGDHIYGTKEEAVSKVREHLRDRDAIFSVFIKTDQTNMGQTGIESMFWEVVEQAMSHTGVPTEGDYIAFQYRGFNVQPSAMEWQGATYLSFGFSMTYYTDAVQEAQVDAAVAQVLNQLNLSGKTEYEKICAIYDYICQNVVYDYDHLSDPSYYLQYTAYAALIDGTAVCQGYANLFYRLALEAGLDARIIAGVSYNEHHAWNIVRIGNWYYNLDSTWDAEMPPEAYRFFLKSEENFLNHFRNEEYTGEGFVSCYPMAAADYDPSMQQPEPEDPTDPEEPAQPTEPEEPTQPTDPEEPTRPTDPEEPTRPTDPEEPTQPTDSEEPTQPTDPEITYVLPFVDVPQDAYYHDPVVWAYTNEITTGKDANHFDPSGECTRAQVVTFLWRAAGKPAPSSGHNPFPDVPNGKYYTDAVLWAVEQGITAGFKDGTFGPNKTCTRAQIVTFLWRFEGQPEPVSMDNPFPDVDVSGYYGKAVLWAVENGITGGFKDGTFGPNKTCKRDQIVTFLYRDIVL